MNCYYEFTRSALTCELAFMSGYFHSPGLHVQRNRIRAAINRVDPWNTALRWGALVSRRKYYVACLDWWSFKLVSTVRPVSYGPRFFPSDLWLARSNSAGLTIKFARTHSYFIIFFPWVFVRLHARTIVFRCFRKPQTKTSSWSSVICSVRVQTDTGNHMLCFHKGSVADTSGLEENKFYVCDVERDILWLVWFNMDFSLQTYWKCHD